MRGCELSVRCDLGVGERWVEETIFAMLGMRECVVQGGVCKSARLLFSVTLTTHLFARLFNVVPFAVAPKGMSTTRWHCMAPFSIDSIKTRHTLFR